MDSSSVASFLFAVVRCTCNALRSFIRSLSIVKDKNSFLPIVAYSLLNLYVIGSLDYI